MRLQQRKGLPALDNCLVNDPQLKTISPLRPNEEKCPAGIWKISGKVGWGKDK